jgi:uncharacterized protein YjbI with pentapeptide repeats
MQNSKTIGNKIVEARKKINMSQADLAVQVAISPQAVGKWERGESMPDITTLSKLSKIFGVDLNYFSDDFQITQTKNSVSESSVRQTTEHNEPKSKKKLAWNWDMSSANWVDGDFSGLKDIQEKFSASNIKNCKFLNSDLSSLILEGNSVALCDFSGSDLRDSKIKASELSKNTFANCSFIDTVIEASEIEICDFQNVNFSGAEFITSEFRNNKIENALWNLTSFKTTHLSNLIFDGKIEDCIFENCSFSKVTFQNAILTNTFFKCKTLKNIKFIDSQADRMTYEFLKNGKANLNGLTIINA